MEIFEYALTRAATDNGPKEHTVQQIEDTAALVPSEGSDRAKFQQWVASVAQLIVDEPYSAKGYFRAIAAVSDELCFE